MSTIGSRAFDECKNLKKVIIGNKIKNIGYRAFANCPELSEVYCLAESVPSCGNEIFEGSYIEYATLYVPEASLDKYQSVVPWNNFKNTVKISPNEHMITYLIDGVVYKECHVVEGETLTPEPAPTKEGYTFSGWSEIPETMPDHDIFVTGTFSVNKSYVLTYILDGNGYAVDVPNNCQLKDKLDEITLSYYMKLPLIDDAAQFSSPCSDIEEGKDFWALLDNNPSTFWHSDWHRHYEGGAHYFQVEMKDEYSEMYDSLVFEFTRRNVEYDHTIEWLVCGTNNYNAERVDCEELLHAYTPFNGVAKAVVSSPFHHKGYKYLRFYSINHYPQYRVFFHLSEFQIHPYQKTPLKDGFTFAGWTLDNGEQLPETMPDHDISVVANFIPSTYYVIYMVDGKEYKTIQYACGSTVTPEAEPTKEGYTFSGWSEMPETMPAHDVIVTGTFAINSYRLTYIVDGKEYKVIKVKYDSKVTPATAPTKEGFTFSGWSEIPETMPSHDVIVTGSFIINKYKLIYKVDGVEYKSYEINYATAITPEAEPAKEGYTFSGWSEIPPKMPAKDVIVTGNFIINKYMLTYMVDGVEYKSFEINYATAITPEVEPSKEGYTFSGWSEIPESMPANDVVVTGTFTVNSYIVRFMYRDEVLYTEEVNYGESIPLPELYDDYGLLIKWLDVPETMPAHDIVILVDETDAVLNIQGEKGDNKVYDLNGHRLATLQKGINIIRMSDGACRKVLIK